eukprot:gene22834-17878_t
MPSITTEQPRPPAQLPPLQTDGQDHPSYSADGEDGSGGATITTGTGIAPGLGKKAASLVSLTSTFTGDANSSGRDSSLPVERPKPVLPWADALRRWRGSNPATSRRIARTLRNVCAPPALRTHGRQDDGVLDPTYLYGWKRPYVPRAELMVQLVTSCLALEQRRRRRGDDIHLFAASLRSMKHEDSWLAMADTMEEHLADLDLSPTLKDFGVMYGCIAKRSNAFPDHPIQIKPRGKSWLARMLARLN